MWPGAGVMGPGPAHQTAPPGSERRFELIQLLRYGPERHGPAMKFLPTLGKRAAEKTVNRCKNPVAAIGARVYSLPQGRGAEAGRPFTAGRRQLLIAGQTQAQAIASVWKRTAEFVSHQPGLRKWRC